MIKVNGKIEKKAYCLNCFQIITWDNVDDEFSSLGHRSVECPYCQADIDVNSKQVEIIEKDIIENPKAYVNGIAYETAADAIANLKAGDKLILEEDVTIDTFNPNNVSINLNGKTLTTTNSMFAQGEVVLSNGNLITTGNTDPLVAQAGSKVTLNNMNITSKHNGVSATGGKIILNDSTISAQEAGILAIDGGSVEINGGNYSTTDNGVIMTNGTDGRGGNTIVINDGKFTGRITSSGYLAHVVYLANTDRLIVNGGIFTVENGSAFVVRGGYLKINPNVTISASGSGTGKVGDGNQLIPAGYDVVIDYKSNYPAVDTINVIAPDRNIHIIEAE